MALTGPVFFCKLQNGASHDTKIGCLVWAGGRKYKFSFLLCAGPLTKRIILRTSKTFALKYLTYYLSHFLVQFSLIGKKAGHKIGQREIERWKRDLDPGSWSVFFPVSRFARKKSRIQISFLLGSCRYETWSETLTCTYLTCTYLKIEGHRSHQDKRPNPGQATQGQCTYSVWHR